MICCVILGYAVAIIIIPVSIIMSTIILLRWLIYILFLPSTYVDYNKPCSVYRMFLDSFIYKRPLISWIMSWIIISTSFDVFDTAGGALAIIVCILIYFKIIFKFELFDEYVPEADEKAFFAEKPDMNDFIPDCVADYTDMDLDVNTVNAATDNSSSSSVSNENAATNESSARDENAATNEKAVEIHEATPTEENTRTNAAKNAFNDAATKIGTATKQAFNNTKTNVRNAANAFASQAKTTTVDNVLKPISNVLTDVGKAVRGSVNGKINKRNTDADTFNAI